MFSGIKGLFNKGNKDLRKRIYFTLFCLGIFALGTRVTLPWADTIYEELGMLELFNLMSGGGLQQFSIFALGVSPYITASIVMQLMQMDIIPYFKELKDQGYTGRQKINKITRYVGIILAFIQAYVISIRFLGTNDITVLLQTCLIMTAGTAFLLWLGDQITQKGIGNGTSLLIMTGIVMSLPKTFTTAFNSFIIEGTNPTLGIILFVAFVLINIFVIVGVVWMQLAERRIPIQYSNRTNSAYGAQQTFLPIKLNAAGVMPVIFASTILTLPTTIVSFMGKQSAIDWCNAWLSTSSWSGMAIYVVMILFFGYFYTMLMMNPEEMSSNLNKNGGYIPGVRPGNDTENYIKNTLSKTTVVGNFFLIIIAVLPILFTKLSALPQEVQLGGTGLLIVVGVAIETYKQIESSLVSRSYRKERKRRI